MPLCQRCRGAARSACTNKGAPTAVAPQRAGWDYVHVWAGRCPSDSCGCFPPGVLRTSGVLDHVGLLSRWRKLSRFAPQATLDFLQGILFSHKKTRLFHNRGSNTHFPVFLRNHPPLFDRKEMAISCKKLTCDHKGFPCNAFVGFSYGEVCLVLLSMLRQLVRKTPGEIRKSWQEFRGGAAGAKALAWVANLPRQQASQRAAGQSISTAWVRSSNSAGFRDSGGSFRWLEPSGTAQPAELATPACVDAPLSVSERCHAAGESTLEGHVQAPACGALRSGQWAMGPNSWVYRTVRVASGASARRVRIELWWVGAQGSNMWGGSDVGSLYAT